MSIKTIVYTGIIAGIFLSSCSTSKQNTQEIETETIKEVVEEHVQKPQHRYGGWYCPDNLNGFPAMDIQDLTSVPVVNGRLPTQEETRNGSSLMFIDIAEYPAAKPLNMTFPKIARYYSQYTHRNEIIIVIQAVEIQKDTVVGFRYLNGGNGSAWFSEVTFLSDNETEKLGSTPFISFETEIKASKEKVWDIITNPEYAKELQETFIQNNLLAADWREDAKMNYKYIPNSIATSEYLTTEMYGNFYIQNDYDFDGYHYTEKHLISEGENNTTLIQTVVGPFVDDFEAQNSIWENWLRKVKEISEKE